MRAHGYRWQTDRTFLSQTALHHASGDIRHPWLIPPTGDVLPGKAAHIAMVLRAQYSLDAYSERAGLPVIHPLLSQPVIEHCLAIPTWLQCAGGCRSEEHTSELQSLMRISYAVFCLKKKTISTNNHLSIKTTR